MKITITATPKFWLSLTLEQVKLLARVSESHYDSVCKSASKIGGFIYGWGVTLTPPASKQVPATRRELDIVLKICEMIDYLEPAEQNELRALCRSIHFAMATANAEFYHWSKECEDTP